MPRSRDESAQVSSDHRRDESRVVRYAEDDPGHATMQAREPEEVDAAAGAGNRRRIGTVSAQAESKRGAARRCPLSLFLCRRPRYGWPDTRVGSYTLKLEPVPSRPLDPLPQQYAIPAVVTLQV